MIFKRDNVTLFQFVIKAVHMRPDPVLPSQECSLKVSILPLRLNVDQVKHRVLCICKLFQVKHILQENYFLCERY